jgi:ATP-dependent protease ClpP protease subunit
MRIDTENIAATIARATGKQEEDLMAVIRRRTTLSPEEAMDFGLVHAIRKELFPRGAEVVSLNIS